MAEAHKEKCQARMLEICEREFPEELKRLQTIPGIKERAATSLIAEIGILMFSYLLRRYSFLFYRGKVLKIKQNH